MARGTNDDVVYLVTGNEDLIAARLSSEHDDDGRDPYALFSDNVARGPVLIDLDGDDAGAAAMATWTRMVVTSNTNNTGGNSNDTCGGIAQFSTLSGALAFH
jgi:hypothetical protein